jgi:serine-type D-Ala-D-Ala endopeptidase (penicillin-binding protein 7)
VVTFRKLIIAAMLVLGTAYAKPVKQPSWIVIENNSVVQSHNIDFVRPMASITKLMTVMVFLDAKTPSQHEKELIQRTIIASDNRAAKELCEVYPGGYADCIYMMNLKAKEMGLGDTKYIEPTGLSIFNVSTVVELAKIAGEASKYPLIVESSNTRSLKLKKRIYNNTNPNVNKHDVLVSKTGFINASGGCIVMMVKTISGTKTVVLLGSKNTKTRIPEMEKLLKS